MKNRYDLLSNCEGLFLIDNELNEKEKIWHGGLNLVNFINDQAEQIRSLEEQLKNSITPKFKVGDKYWAIVSLQRKIECPKCKGQYSKTINDNGFKGEIKCSYCNYGKVDEYKKGIVPFVLKEATYSEGWKLERSEVIFDESMLNDYSVHWKNSGIYGDYESDYDREKTWSISNQDLVFATREEAEKQLAELEGK